MVYRKGVKPRLECGIARGPRMYATNPALWAWLRGQGDGIDDGQVTILGKHAHHAHTLVDQRIGLIHDPSSASPRSTNASAERTLSARTMRSDTSFQTPKVVKDSA